MKMATYRLIQKSYLQMSELLKMYPIKHNDAYAKLNKYIKTKGLKVPSFFSLHRCTMLILEILIKIQKLKKFIQHGAKEICKIEHDG